MTAVPGYTNYDKEPPKDTGKAVTAHGEAAKPVIADRKQYEADVMSVIMGTKATSVSRRPAASPHAKM